MFEQIDDQAPITEADFSEPSDSAIAAVEEPTPLELMQDVILLQQQGFHAAIDSDDDEETYFRSRPFYIRLLTGAEELLLARTGEGITPDWDEMMQLLSLFCEAYIQFAPDEIKEYADFEAILSSFDKPLVALAQHELAQRNQRLVVSIMKHYMGRGTGMLDMIQEGNVGLMRGIQKFDYLRGYRFTTYATYWVRQSISRQVNGTGSGLRVPESQIPFLGRIRDMQAAAYKSGEGWLTDIVIAERIFKETPDKAIGPDMVHDLRRAMQTSLEMDTPTNKDGDGGSDTMGDLLEDGGRTDSDDNLIEKRVMLEAIDKAGLTEIENQVISLMFWDDLGATAISRELGILVREVNLHKKNALAKLGNYAGPIIRPHIRLQNRRIRSIES